MQNLVVHITLPKTLALSTGAILGQDVTFDVVSALSPFYGAIDQLRFVGGVYLRKLADLTLAAAIYEASKQADRLCYKPPIQGTEAFDHYAYARNQWVTNKAAMGLMLNILNQFGKQTHVLGNFSVTQENDPQKKIDELQAEIVKFEVALRSCGQTIPGGKAKPGMAAKGVNDWMERTPSRTWAVTGMGANQSSGAFTATGGRGKSFSYFQQTYSPPIVSVRMGIFQGFFPLGLTTP
jgi:hypothetical protein